MFTEKELKKLPVEDGFRMRGMDMTRLETFIDAAFAFATTMLVISIGQIPGNFEELVLALKQIPACASSFFIIMLYWRGHRTWSRRYGLEDKVTIMISVSMIFVLLVYIYPLRLMFSALFSWISNGWFRSVFRITAYRELIGLFIIYGIGLAAMAGLMAVLYWRAKKASTFLALDPIELIRTESEIVSYIIVAGTGLMAALFAWVLPPYFDLAGGFLYATLPVSVSIVNSRYKKKERIVMS